jgi:hypothetical protein
MIPLLININNITVSLTNKFKVNHHEETQITEQQLPKKPKEKGEGVRGATSYLSTSIIG